VAATTLTPARVLRPPRHVDGRALAGLFLTVVSVLGALVFWNATSDTRPVVIATRDRPAGAQLTAGDLAVARVRVDDAVYRAAVPATDRGQLIGRPLAEPVHAQQVLVRAQLGSRPALAADQLGAIIPVSPDTAPGLRVRPGDAVQVLVTLDKGKAESHTDVVLERAVVLDVGYDERRSGPGPVPAAVGSAPGDGLGRSGTGQPTTITLAVTQAEARRLATARWNGSLDVLSLPPEATPQP